MEKLLIFDLDNTLIRYKDLGKYVDELLVGVLKTLYPKRTLPEKTAREQLWAAGINYPELLNSWGIVDIQEFWAEFDKQDYDKRVNMSQRGEITLTEDVIYTLDELVDRGHNLAVLSNSNVPICHYLCEFFEIDHYFATMMGLDPEKSPEKCKPEPENLKILINQIGYEESLEHVYMIGDSFSDVLAAKRTEIHAILFSPLERRENPWKDEITESDYMRIQKMKEILSFVP